MVGIRTGHRWNNSLYSQTVQLLSEQVFSLLNYRAHHYKEGKNSVFKRQNRKPLFDVINRLSNWPPSLFRDYESSKIKKQFALTCNPPPRMVPPSHDLASDFPGQMSFLFLITGPDCSVNQEFLLATMPPISFPSCPYPH